MPSHALTSEPADVALHPRNVQFDWSSLPLKWIPNELFASHLINVLHLLLPEGERWFVEVFKQALPMIKDDKLREDVLGFIGQEGVHASAHQGVLDYFDGNGLDTGPFVEEVSYLFQRLLGDRNLSGDRAEEWLVERLSVIAGIEHITGFLGDWILNSDPLDKAGANTTMLDLLRWHGAEEVEHRAVAYDLYQHIDGRYVRRSRDYALVLVVLVWLWIRGVRYLIENDPTTTQKPTWPWLVKSYVSAGRRGLHPVYTARLIKSAVRYFLPGYHPSDEGSTSQAVEYLAKSPAALAAAT